MRRSAWICLLAAGTLAGFVIGATVGKNEKSEMLVQRPTANVERKEPESDEVRALLASIEEWQSVLAEKAGKARELETELAEVEAKLPPPPTPQELEKQREEEEKRKRDERRKAREEKSKKLRTKILQRRDKALRAEGLTELAALLQSGDIEEFLVGLMSLSRVSSIDFDKKGFRAQILAAINHEDSEVRCRGADCLTVVCDDEEAKDIIFQLASDPSADVRNRILWRLGWAGMGGRQEEVVSLLRKLLHDDDKNVRRGAFQQLSQFPPLTEALAPGELEDMAIVMSRDEENRDEAVRWLRGRREISENVARRLVELYEEVERGSSRLDLVTHRGLSEEAKPIAAELCLRVLRDSIEYGERLRALNGLGNIGDVSVLPELEEIARGPDAEGIEKQLAETIERLRMLGTGMR